MVFSIHARLERMLETFRSDVEAVRDYDPAAGNLLDVMVAYPGLHAIWMHRISRGLWLRNCPFGARALSTFNRFLTGVEIHPGAHIGRGVFIDHGMGIVIGETARVGDGCILFKGVVLGGTSNARGVRHPQLGDRVVVGTNACVLGNIRVGSGARIGSGSVVVRPVPAESTVVGVPGRVVRSTDSRSRFDDTLDHADLPDPVNQMIRSLRRQNEILRDRIARLEGVLQIESEFVEDDDPHLVDVDLVTRDLPKQAGG